MKRFIAYIKIVWIFFWAGLATCLLFLPIYFASILSTTGNLAFTLSKLWAWTMLIITGVRPHIRGKEKIKPGQSYIIISNHQSHFDILALVTRLGIQFRWIIKKELLKVPLFGYALYKSRNIFVDRSDHDKATESINKGLERLPRGVSVMFFAEGTRSKDGAIGPFKKGGFRCALHDNRPILPVTVNGSRKALPKGSLVFHPCSIEVVVGDPIDTTSYTLDSIEALMGKTRSVVISNHNPDH